MSERIIEPSRSTASLELSVILATLNERENLPELANRLLPAAPCSSEFIVVDDGSTDGTREFLQELASKDPRVRVLYHEGKQTTLRAQCQAIAVARGRFVVVMDADLQHPPELLPKMVGALEGGAALVVASRYAPGGSPGFRTLGRRAMSRGAEWLAKLALPTARQLTDPVSGYFAFTAELWKPIDPTYRGYKLLLFVIGMAQGLPMREIGYRFEPRTGGKSKVTGGSNFISVFLRELMLARRFYRATQATRISPP